VTGKIVDIIANGDPDTTHFKSKMDDLNRFCRFYGIKAAQARTSTHDRHLRVTTTVARASIFTLCM
jgi:hypothetical protein